MSTCRYGDGTLYGAVGLTYGAATVDRPMTWIFAVDWDGDGSIDGENDGRYMVSMETETGRQWPLNGSGDGFEPVMVGQGSVTLLNTDGRFDPFNLDSPLAGKILPGRKFILQVQRESDGTRQPVMTGRIEDIRPIYGDVNQVKLTLKNAVEDLKQKNIRTTVQNAIRYDAALAACLSAYGWTDGSDIDTTVSEAMEYWWASGKSAFAEIQGIADAAMGMFCIAEDGTAVYKSRVSDDTPLMTITDAEIDWNYGVKTPTPWDSIRNNIRVYARKRTLQTSVTLWSTSDKVLIPARESREIWAEFSVSGDDATASAITTPASGTDYVANSASDGSGTNLTANITVSVSGFARSAKLTVSNTGGTNVYMTTLQLRGSAIVADKYTFVESQDADSIEAFGERRFEVRSDWLQDINTARDEADILKSRLAYQRQYPRFRVLLDQFDVSFGARLFGLVLVNFAKNGISGEYRFGYIKHRWIDELGYQVETEIYLEPNLLGNVSGTWIFPAVFGVTTVF